MKSFLVLLSLLGLSWAASANGESKHFVLDNFDSLDLAELESLEEAEPYELEQPEEVVPEAAQPVDDGVDRFDLGENFALIPLRFDSDGAPWVALRSGTQGFTWETFPSGEHSLIDDHLESLMDSASSPDRRRMQYLYGWRRVFIVDDVAVPENNVQHIDDGNFRWFNLSQKDAPAGVNAATWAFLWDLHIEPNDFFTRIPFNIYQSRADIRVAVSAAAPQKVPNLGATCFMNAALQMLFYLEPFTSEVLAAVMAKPLPLTDSPLVLLGMFDAQLLTQQEVTPNFMHNWINYIRDNYGRDIHIAAEVQNDSAQFIQQYLPRIQKELLGNHQWKLTFMNRLLMVNRELFRQCDRWGEHRRLPVERQSDFFWEVQPITDEGDDAYDLHHLLRKSLNWSLFENVHGHDGCNLKHQARLRDLPPILMIKLNRLDWGPAVGHAQKIMRPINFPFRALDLTDYVDLQNDERFVYDLVATINHTGSHQGGHYTTSIFRSDAEAFLLSDRIIADNVTVPSLLEFSRNTAVLLTYVRRSQADSQNVERFDEATLTVQEGQAEFDYSKLYSWDDHLKTMRTARKEEPVSVGAENDAAMVPLDTRVSPSHGASPIAAIVMDEEYDPELAQALRLSLESASSSSTPSSGSTPVASEEADAEEDDFDFAIRLSTMSETEQSAAIERREAAKAARLERVKQAWKMPPPPTMNRPYVAFDEMGRYGSGASLPASVFGGQKRKESVWDHGLAPSAKRARTELSKEVPSQAPTMDPFDDLFMPMAPSSSSSVQQPGPWTQADLWADLWTPAPKDGKSDDDDASTFI